MNHSFPPNNSSIHYQPRRSTGNPAREMVASTTFRVLAFLVLHMGLALVINRISLLATIHALGTALLSVYFLVHDEKPDRLIYIVAYIAGMELLWRGSNAAVFWEFGKYIDTGLLLLSLVKRQKLGASSKWPLIYFVLLIPSVTLLPTFNREDISFNMSGPLFLAVATMYFSTVKLNESQVKRILLMFLGPAVGLAFLSNFVIITTNVTEFIPGSKATSAGIGPNQVSSIMGLGVFAAFFLAMLEKRHTFLRFFMVIVTVWLLSQAALTLSRGGFWTGVGAIVVSTLFLLRDPRARGMFVVGILLIYFIGRFAALPFLDDFTNGVVSARLQDTDLTGRDKIMLADWYTFRNNPFFGVGPGQSFYYHALTFRFSAAHTEYSRLLAEHGSAGGLALFILLALGVRYSVASRQSPRHRALAIGCVVWTLLYMVHAAMRLAAPSLLFGLAAVVIVQKADNSDVMTVSDHSTSIRRASAYLR